MTMFCIEAGSWLAFSSSTYPACTRLLFLFLDAGLRGAQRLLGRGLVAATAFFVEVDRRRMQAQDQAGGLGRQRRVAEVFRAQLGETEFLFARHFPQEVEVDVGRDRLGLFHQI